MKVHLRELEQEHLEKLGTPIKMYKWNWRDRLGSDGEYVYVPILESKEVMPLNVVNNTACGWSETVPEKPARSPRFIDNR